MPPLTVAALRGIVPDGTVRRFYDTGGLYLETSRAGGKYWRMKYRFDGRERRLSFGPWPEVSLARAREMRDDARRRLRSGVEPGANRRNVGETLREIAEEYLSLRSKVLSPQHLETMRRRCDLYIYPRLGNRAVNSITPTEVLEVVRRIENRDIYETARRVLGLCSLICRYAVATGRAASDPCRDLRGALAPRVVQSLSAITTPQEAGRLMAAITRYPCSEVVRHALRFSALTFCRPGEIRRAEWAEIDKSNTFWVIPAEKMKMRRKHRVPLSSQAMDLLASLKPLTGHSRYLFPGARNPSRPMSENTVAMALRLMGYDRGKMTAHGFRSMASTLLNELGHRPDVIEAQLAHQGYDRIRAIYNRAQYLEERITLMQVWADYLDSLEAAAYPGDVGN